VLSAGIEAPAVPRPPPPEYKAESVVTPTGAVPFPTRTVYNRHGVRVVVTQTGRIGRFNFQVGCTPFSTQLLPMMWRTSFSPHTVTPLDTGRRC